MRIRIWVFLAALVSSAAAKADEPWQAPDSPFVIGEGYPATPATCESVRRWIEKAPSVDGRVSFAIRGELIAAEWDGTLAYLVMCEESGVQVLCVTYGTNGQKAGDTVLFGGGYARIDERRILLDPCIATVGE
jgi:hypothetical protein